LRAGAASIGDHGAFGDRALQDCSRINGVARAGEPIGEPPRRGAAPKILERDDALGDCRRGHAKHRLRRAQVKTRHHGQLPAANDLPMHPLPYAERVYVETTSCRWPEASDKMDLGARDRDARHIAVDLIHEQRRHGGGGRRARRHEILENNARVHGISVDSAGRSRKCAPVRFFQSAAGADD
jgi:hypothetical protein